MLQHIGPKRTNAHNVKLAALLSLTAGFVNAAGYLSFFVFTTNVTGHVALFAEKLAAGQTDDAWLIGIWMLMFLLGAFVCGIMINAIGPNQRFGYALPIIVESMILILAADHVHWLSSAAANHHFITGGLLFAMGLQNAMVSMISGSVVRTTHLTGMFTDLGIELAGGLYALRKGRFNHLLCSQMVLRLIIIVCFFTGCILSAYIFRQLNYKTFYIPAALLVFSLLFDISRIKTIRLYRKIKLNLTGHAE